MTHERLLFSHPVLRPKGIDYAETSKFNVEVMVKNEDNKIHLDLKYDLQSNFLTGLIKEGQARYLAVVKCSKTGQRKSFKSEGSIKWALDSGEFRDMLQLSMYVVSEQHMEKFESEEHDAEIRGIANNIPIGSILALTNRYDITLDKIDGDLESIINLIMQPDIKDDWLYYIELKDVIEISMNEKTYKATNHLRNRMKHVLFPLLYVPAIAKAIQKDRDDGGDDSLWAMAIRSALDGYSDDEDPNILAQKIMKYPYGSIQKLLDDDHD